MTVSIWVEQRNGSYTATVAGLPHLTAEGRSEDDAVASLRAVLDAPGARGKLRTLDVPRAAVTDFAGSHRDDPFLREIVEEAYRLRDEEKAREFGE